MGNGTPVRASTTTADDVPRQNIFVTCKDIGFANGVDYTAPPTVLVMANHETDDNSYSSAVHHPETMTWVDGVSNDEFRVCSSTRASNIVAAGNTLKWDWVALPNSQANPDRSTGATVNSLALAADVVV